MTRNYVKHGHVKGDKETYIIHIKGTWLWGRDNQDIIKDYFFN